jgi:endo-1,4-beta-xylanase
MRRHRKFLVSLFFVLVLALVVLSGRQLWAQWRTPDLPDPPLKVLAAARGVDFGNYAALKLLDEPAYLSILNTQYAFVSVDGELNWTFNDGALRPSSSQFDYSNPDKVFAFAEAHKFPVQAHHLVWGEEKWLPAWLKDGNYSKDQLLDLIHQHIDQVAGHYKGRVREWSVVNEPFTRGQHIFGLRDWWADHIGDQSYIDQSFIWAHQADPNAKLILNDFYVEGMNQYSDAMYAYVKDAKARGVPIDGVGMQMHIGGDVAPSKTEVIKSMQRFADLGLDIYVTEFDVNMNFVQGSYKERMDKEAQIYKDMVGACVESKVCHSFAELGITDKDSWYNELGMKDSQALPFDQYYRPKPAFYAIRDAFQR